MSEIGGERWLVCDWLAIEMPRVHGDLCRARAQKGEHQARTYILVLNVLKELQLSVCSLRQDRGRKWLHDLLDRDGSPHELILCRTGNADMRYVVSIKGEGKFRLNDI